MFFMRVFESRVKQIALFSFLAITCITFFKTALELEDAEQAYYSQWLRWGYDDQPPLYTWLQYDVNKIFGVNKLSFSVLRASLFSSVLVVLWHFGRHMRLNEKQSELAVFSLVLLPVFIDFMFRRLSHTSLLCLLILVSFIVIQRLLQDKTYTNYLCLGLVVGLGILSKYNYVLFLATFGIVLFFDKGLRQVVFNKKILLSVCIASLLLSPHVYWLLGPDGHLMELRESIALKTERNSDTGLYLISPLFSFVVTVLKLLAPLLVVLLVAYILKLVNFRKPELDWFTKFGMVQLFFLLLFFIVFNVQKVEERWLLPLLLPFMVLLMRSVEFKSVHKWSSYLFRLFLVVIALQVVRTPVEKALGIPSSVHFGFQPLSNLLNTSYANQQWVLPDVTYGGNICILNPNTEIFSKDDFSLPSYKVDNTAGVEVIVGKENLKGRLFKEQLNDFGKEKDTLFMVLFKERLLLLE